MSDDEQWQVREWVAAWRRAGPELERVLREELRAFRHEDNVEIIGGLLQIGCQFAEPRTTSGLVEQQRWFQEARR